VKLISSQRRRLSMPLVEMVSCPFCNVYWVNPMTEEVCAQCKEPYHILQTVMAVHSTIQDVDKLDFNKLDSEHRRVLRAAATHLDAILDVLDRYPKKE
jgi:hypothetical protein